MLSWVKQLFCVSGFSPAHISGLALWLDAQDGASPIVENGEVAEWTDKSGHANHATHAIENERPGFDPLGIHGKPALTFGETARLYVADSPSLDFTGMHLYVVCQPEDGTSRSRVIATKFSTDAQGREWQLEISAAQRFGFLGSVDGSIAGTHVVSPSPVAFGQPCLLHAWYDGAEVSISVNGGDKTSLLLGAFSNTPNPIILGRGAVGGAFQGKIGEVLFFSRALTAAEHAKVQQYLMRKWTLS